MRSAGTDDDSNDSRLGVSIAEYFVDFEDEWNAVSTSLTRACEFG